MSSVIREALLRSGVYLDGTSTIEPGAGNYMVIRDRTGRVTHRIEEAMLSSKIIVREI